MPKVDWTKGTVEGGPQPQSTPSPAENGPRYGGPRPETQAEDPLSKLPDYYWDPRPEIEEDHKLWVTLLTMAYRKDEQLWGMLYGLRGEVGTRLVKTPTGGYRLDIPYQELVSDDPGWRSESEIRTRWLDPYKEAIVELLNRLKETDSKVIPGLTRVRIWDEEGNCTLDIRKRGGVENGQTDNN